MKKGFRSPSIKKSISARTTGKINRSIKKATNPLYGKKGMGYINNPQKAIYNKVYNKTTVGVNQVFKGASSVSRNNFDAQTALTRIKQLNETAQIINTTTNVSTFFSRYEFALQICDELVNYEYTGVIKTITPRQQKRELLEQIPSVINSLIVRSYNKEYAKAQELKTDKGRKNRMIHFFNILIEELNHYGAKYITETNISKIHELLSQLSVENEIIVNLTPVTITLPPLELANAPYSPKSDNKIISDDSFTSEYDATQKHKKSKIGFYFFMFIGIVLLIENILIIYWGELNIFAFICFFCSCVVTYFYYNRSK